MHIRSKIRLRRNVGKWHFLFYYIFETPLYLRNISAKFGRMNYYKYLYITTNTPCDIPTAKHRWFSCMELESLFLHFIFFSCFEPYEITKNVFWVSKTCQLYLKHILKCLFCGKSVSIAPWGEVSVSNFCYYNLNSLLINYVTLLWIFAVRKATETFI